MTHQGCYVVQGDAAMLGLCIKCDWAEAVLCEEAFMRTIAFVAISTRIAVSTRMSNVRLPVQETADFAHEIHSQPKAPEAQPMAPQGNREGAIGATISNTDCQCHAYWIRPGPK